MKKEQAQHFLGWCGEYQKFNYGKLSVIFVPGISTTLLSMRAITTFTKYARINLDF